MKVKITKLEELNNAVHPNNIPVGFEKIVEVNKWDWKKPKVGEHFILGGFYSSIVQEILENNTFKTFNSIYQYEILEKNTENEE